MKYQSVHIDYSVEFLSSFHCGAGEGRGLADRLVRRDADDFLVIPGSTIKGLVRENCEFLTGLFGVSDGKPHLPQDEKEIKKYFQTLFSNYNIIHAIFGSPRQAGLVNFDDASLDDEWKTFFSNDRSPEHNLRQKRWQVEERTRVRINRHTGAAVEGALFTSNYGKTVLTFKGKIYGSYAFPAMFSGIFSYPLPLLVLLTGLKLVENIGADRSTGCGRCQIEINRLKSNGKEENPEHVFEAIDELQYLSTAAEEWNQ